MLNTSPKLLKHLAVVGALAATTWLGTALAQTSAPPTEAPPTTPETHSMETYLTNHPKVAEELHNNPSLINDPNWLAKHPHVQNWMANHPNVKADAAAHPASFVGHTERETLTRDRTGLRGTDEFLSKHPEMAKELNANPRLIDNSQYLADHPALNKYLADHPGVKNEWMKHPEYFAKGARAENRSMQKAKESPATHTKTPRK